MDEVIEEKLLIKLFSSFVILIFTSKVTPLNAIPGASTTRLAAFSGWAAIPVVSARIKMGRRKPLRNLDFMAFLVVDLKGK